MRIVIFAAGAGGIAALFLPPLFHSEGSTQAYLLALIQFRSPIYGGVPALSWIFVATVFYGPLWLLARARSYLGRQFVPISVLETRLVLRFTDETLIRAFVDREQLFHANRRGMRAYHFQHSPSRHDGAIDEDTIFLESRINDEVINERRNGRVHLIKALNARRGIDVVEVYDRELPVSLWATLLPNDLVLNLFKFGRYMFFRTVVVSRRGTVTYVDEYNGDRALFQITALRYPVSNVSLEVRFPTAVSPDRDRLQAMIIRENVVQEKEPYWREEGGLTVFAVSTGRFANATLRLVWENHKLARPGT